MITKTNKFKVKTDTFLYTKGEIVHTVIPEGVSLEGYVDILEPIYKLEDGTEVCVGDHIWCSKNYEVKSTLFSTMHIEQNIPIFGTRKDCEEWINQNIKTELLKQNRESSFQTLKSWVNKLNNLDSLSYNDLEKIRYGIQTTIKNMEKI